MDATTVCQWWRPSPKMGSEKISFAGDGPTLCPWLPDLIRRASELRVTSSVATNGSRITDEWVEGVGEILD